MTNRIGMVVLVLLGLLASAGQVAAFEWGITGELDFVNPDDVLDRSIEADLDIMRVQVNWRDYQNFLTDPQHPRRILIEKLQAAGIDPIVLVGNGFKWELPPSRKNPDTDPDKYIQDISNYAYEVAAYLKTIGVYRFQIENELNAAGFASLPPFMWREGFSWWKKDFKLGLIKGLSEAVRRANPNAEIWTNFHTSIQDPPFWVGENITDWEPYLDGIGLDYYPNYLLYWPRFGDKLAEMIRLFKTLTNKPIMIFETGYASRGYGHNVPGMNDYVIQVSRAAYNEGAIGLIYFTLFDSPPQIFGLNPNNALEPNFGLLDRQNKPKIGEDWKWNWSTFKFDRKIVVPWETYKDIIRLNP